MDKEKYYDEFMSPYIVKYKNNSYEKEIEDYYDRIMKNSIYGKYVKSPEKTDEEILKEERIRKLNEIL